MNDLVKTTQAILEPSKALQIQNGELVPTDDLLAFMDAALTLQKQIDEGWGIIKAFMVEHKIDTTKGDWGYLTVGWNKTYVVSKELPPRFYKKTINNDMIKLYEKAHGKLPKNVTIKKGPKLLKDLK